MVKAKVIGKVIHVVRKLPPFSKHNIKTSEEHYLAGIDNSMSIYTYMSVIVLPHSQKGVIAVVSTLKSDNRTTYLTPV